ncbi:RNA polymerase sigma-70 factor [Ulvibacterium sp.]|uniref:RNA polymerase sigma-70 factor n=1 Tax=Ulvibacterium sp. TaxID=2665914 RepID=UPI00262007E3|nr:RNA polymerase sigma-70 factor [Ulvibacterium sp.]
MLRISNTQELLRRIASDDVDAFEEIYKTYSGKMLLYGLNVLKKREIIEDIVQNIFTDLWVKRRDVNISNLQSYLFRAVKYQIFNHLRSNKLSQKDLTRFNIIDLSMNISRDLEYSELEEIIQDCVGKLPDRCQQIFVLSRYQHKSNKEIATALDISIQAVKNQISKAIGIIRYSLQQEELILPVLLLNFPFFS